MTIFDWVLESRGFTKYKTTRYLTFYRGKSDSGKTARVLILGKSGGLGEIKWFSKWRQYAFFPTEETIWNRECMADVMIEIDRLTQERKLVRSGVAKERS